MKVFKYKLFRYITVGFSLFTVLVFITSSCEKEKFDDTKFGSVSGQVSDADGNDDGSQMFIEGAIVTTTPATSSVTTDAEGRFSIPNIPTGDVIVLVNKVDYSQKSTTVNVKENKNTDMVIQMTKTDRKSTVDFLLIYPEENAVDQEINLELAWALRSQVSFPDTIFDLYLIESNNAVEKIGENLQDTTFTLSALKYETTYFWQLDLKEEDDGSVIKKGPLWSFKTKNFPDFPVVYAKLDEGIYNIYSLAFEIDTTEINITEKESSSNWMPTYNKTRSHIAFSSNRTIDPQIYLMKKDGKEVSPITKLPNVGFHNQGDGFCWSPDNQRILYSNFDKLYSIKTTGTELNLVTTATLDPVNSEKRHFRKVNWNGYTNKIIAQTIGEKIFDGEIYIMDADGSNSTLLVSNTVGREDSPSLSIDGSKYIYTHDASGFEDDYGRQLNCRIYMHRVDGTGEIVDMSHGKDDGTNDINPRFSPNGASIIFENVDNTGEGKHTVMIMDLEGNDRKEFSEGEMPYWG